MGAALSIDAYAYLHASFVCRHSGRRHGGSIRDGSGRLDFDFPESTLDKAQVTEALNRLIARTTRCSRVGSPMTSWQKPDLVRTMSVAPPMGHGRVRLLDIEGVDLQPCGGTHVANTGRSAVFE